MAAAGFWGKMQFHIKRKSLLDTKGKQLQHWSNDNTKINVFSFIFINRKTFYFNKLFQQRQNSSYATLRGSGLQILQNLILFELSGQSAIWNIWESFCKIFWEYLWQIFWERFFVKYIENISAKYPFIWGSLQSEIFENTFIKYFENICVKYFEDICDKYVEIIENISAKSQNLLFEISGQSAVWNMAALKSLRSAELDEQSKFFSNF